MQHLFMFTDSELPHIVFYYLFILFFYLPDLYSLTFHVLISGGDTDSPLGYF